VVNEVLLGRPLSLLDGLERVLLGRFEVAELAAGDFLSYDEPMDARLPQPDPYESFGMKPTDDTRVLAPTAVFVMGRPSPETDRLSDAILDLRPGVLIVVAPA
jgi:hypothetical protein